MKSYIEVTLSYDDTDPETITESHREAGDDGVYGESSEEVRCAAKSIIGLPWIQLEMKLEV